MMMMMMMMKIFWLVLLSVIFCRGYQPISWQLFVAYVNTSTACSQRSHYVVVVRCVIKICISQKSVGMQHYVAAYSSSSYFELLLLFGSKLGFSRIFDSLSSAHRIHDFTDFRRPNFTKFERNTSIGIAMNPFIT